MTIAIQLLTGSKHENTLMLMYGVGVVVRDDGPDPPTLSTTTEEYVLTTEDQLQGEEQTTIDVVNSERTEEEKIQISAGKNMHLLIERIRGLAWPGLDPWR